MRGFRVATLFGIPLELNPSWAVIFVILLWTLSGVVFPRTYPGLGTLEYLALGLGSALLFFASLVAHELSHSLVSMRFGLKVRRIVLFVFGGISETTRELPSPGVEFLVAIAGPATSFVLAGLFGLLARWLDVWAGGFALAGACGWLAIVNLALGLFNLLPGFPLDGGRVLRAAAWKATGSLTRATRLASWGGQLVGGLMVAWGLWNLLRGDLFGAVWIGLLGMLLFQAAGSEYGQVLANAVLGRLRVEELMTRDPTVLHPDQTLQEVVDAYLLRHPFGGYPVVDGRLDGLLQANQVKSVPADTWGQAKVGDVMMPLTEGDALRPEQSAAEAVERLNRLGVGRLPVVEGGQVVGILSQSDVIRWLVWHPSQPGAS